jgi:hypothetical protein
MDGLTGDYGKRYRVLEGVVGDVAQARDDGEAQHADYGAARDCCGNW